MAMKTHTREAGSGLVAARDGRAERGERTRDAVVDALLLLLDDGFLRPSARQISERAGVSLRTVFHHFDDLDALHSAASDRQIERLVALTKPLARTGPLASRIDAFVAARARLHEAIAPVRRAALLSEPFSPAIASRLRWVRVRGRREAERVFAIELDRRPVTDRRELLEAVTVVSSWSAWEALRAHQGLSMPQARRIMARTVMALLKETE